MGGILCVSEKEERESGKERMRESERGRMETNIPDPKLKIVLLGDSGVGKSSIINRYVFKKFEHKVDVPQVVPTQIQIDGKDVNLQILDTNGQEHHGGLEATFFSDAKGCMLVYDVHNSKSFDNLENWHNEFILRVKSNRSDCESFPFIILGNKDDINGGKTKELSERAWERCPNVAKIYHLLTSAKENKNLSEAFDYIAKAALKKEAMEVKSTNERQIKDSEVSEQDSTTAPSFKKRRTPSFKKINHVPNTQNAKIVESDNINKVQNGNSQIDIRVF